MNSSCVGVGGWDGRCDDMDAEWCRFCVWGAVGVVPGVERSVSKDVEPTGTQAQV